MIETIKDYITNILCAIYSMFYDPFDGKEHGLAKPTKRESWIHRQARIRGEYFRQVGYGDAMGHPVTGKNVPPRSKNPFYMHGYASGVKDRATEYNLTSDPKWL